MNWDERVLRQRVQDDRAERSADVRQRLRRCLPVRVSVRPHRQIPETPAAFRVMQGFAMFPRSKASKERGGLAIDEGRCRL